MSNAENKQNDKPNTTLGRVKTFVTRLKAGIDNFLGVHFYWIMVIALISLFLGLYNYARDKQYTDLGTMGDYWGGMLNPAFGFFTLLLVFHSWRIQRDQANDTREQLALSQLEHDRRQLEDMLIRVFQQVDALHDKRFPCGYMPRVRGTIVYTLAEAINSDKTSNTVILSELAEAMEKGQLPPQVFDVLLELKRLTHHSMDMTTTIIGMTRLPQLKGYWALESISRLEAVRILGLLESKVLDDYHAFLNSEMHRGRGLI